MVYILICIIIDEDEIEAISTSLRRYNKSVDKDAGIYSCVLIFVSENRKLKKNDKLYCGRLEMVL